MMRIAIGAGRIFVGLLGVDVEELESFYESEAHLISDKDLT